MGFNWRELLADELEAHFNPRASVSNVEQYLAHYIARSAQARAEMPGEYDIRYGKGEKQTLDLHALDLNVNSRPLVLFIHGGFWRGLDKSDHSFVVPPLLQTGAVVANVNYDLCPVVTLDTIVAEIAQAVAYCHHHAVEWGADPQAMYLVGHSAGAHLAAEMLLRDWSQAGIKHDGAIRGVAALTGVYEPEVILGISVNDEAKITPQTARERSCLDKQFRLYPEMLIAVGDGEPEGWVAQSESFADVCRTAGLSTRLKRVDGANHFTLLENAAQQGHPLHDDICGLWR